MKKDKIDSQKIALAYTFGKHITDMPPVKRMLEKKANEKKSPIWLLPTACLNLLVGASVLALATPPKKKKAKKKK